ncbi:MAG: tRNA (adenosine(37)-N6)-threonylcarbamoyltransferase complex dimerization subunit type 1 TsaB [Myxococcales bacterium]|nr:tRNA (adenosine(37)-N6)-threonylcarbamoyltransferase complex dimerization subunit type 1 TsaB [Myxococcales bacterium]
MNSAGAASVKGGGELCLALCSATRIASVALLAGDKLVVEHAAETDRHQAESLLPLIDRVLQESEIRIDDLAAIALSIGPGSFTNLRIGVATVKGLVLGTRVKVIPISTLQALAEASSDTAAVVVGALNAQRGEVYAAGFAGSDQGFAPREDVLPELVYSADELAERLPSGCRIVGDGALIVAERLRELRSDEIRCSLDEVLEPSASSIGRLALSHLAAGKDVAASALAPRYVRRAEAEVSRTAERFEPPSGV